MKLMRCVCRDVGGLAGSHHRFRAPESDLDLAFENAEHLLEIVAMRRRASAGRNKHVDEAIASGGLLSGQEDRVSVARQPDVV